MTNYDSPYNVIGDIAGNYETLQMLLAKMPPGKVLAVGDLVDRGPRSPAVVKFFMDGSKTGGAEALKGNHEHMMVVHLRDQYRFYNEYDRDIWLVNGGLATMRSYGNKVPEDHLAFLEHLPLFKRLAYPGLRVHVSHAPYDHNIDPANHVAGEPYKDVEFAALWNRGWPQTSDAFDLSIHGHNARFREFREPGETKPYSICIDDSREKVLMGIHLPTLELFRQEYVD